MASIVQRASGLWQAKVRKAGAKPVSRTFATKLQAREWAAAQEADIARGDWRDRRIARRMTVTQLLNRYESDVLPGKKSRHVAKYHVARFREDLGHLVLTALTGAALAEWRDARLRCVAAATVNRELSTLGGVLTWARKDLGLPIEHVVSAIRRPVQGRARDRRLEGDEEQRLLDALEDHAGDVQGTKRAGAYRVGTRNPWMRPLVQIAIETAMRQGELLALTWDNMDLKTQTAHLEDTKNGESRTVPLTCRAVAVLEALPRPPGGRVFPLTAQAVELAWKRACKRAGIEGLHFHDLRHEATSRLFELGLNVMEVAAVTGHKDLRSLKRYTHIDPAHLARKIADLKSQQQQPGTTASRRGRKKNAG